MFVNPPFVIKDGDHYSGIAIELWRDVANKLDYKYSFVEYPHVSNLLDATHDGKMNIAVTNITVNQPRAQRVTFTQPWMDGGYRIMVAKHQGEGFSGLWGGLKKAGYLKAYALVVAAIIAATLLITLFDRRFDASFPKRWRDGIAESFYSVMSVAVSGSPPQPKNLFGWAGRIGQALWLVCGVAIFAFVTSSMTSVLTTLKLTGEINSLHDVQERTVGVIRQTVQADYARDNGLSAISYDNLDEAVHGLTHDQVAALIYDARSLEYYVTTHPKEPVKVVGRLFEKAKYAFALPRDSDLRVPITIAILGTIDTGAVEDMKLKYLGQRTP